MELQVRQAHLPGAAIAAAKEARARYLGK